jgi:hypothetical protein
MTKHMLLASLLLGACATDSTTNTVDQDVSIWDDCATGTSAANALVGEPPDSYTRSGSTINQTCGCKQWQIDNNAFGKTYADSHNPDCRPTTIVDFGLHVQQGGYLVGAEVPTWNISDQTECQNSTLHVKVQQWDGTQYNDLWTPPDASPVWSGGTCHSVSLYHGPFWNVPGPLRVRAKATRGLDDFNHGFEGVKVQAFVY